MILSSFSGLNHANLNDGVNTIAATHAFPQSPAKSAQVPILGGYLNRYAGTQGERQAPSRAVGLRYHFRGTHADLMGHINMLEIDDKGKTGTITWNGEDGETYTAVGYLRDFSWEQRHPGSGNALITLQVELMTEVEQS